MHTRESLLQRLAWNLERCVIEVLSRNLSGENVAYALVNYASAAVAVQRRVRADYIRMLRQRRPGIYPPYIHHSGEGGATTREQIYNRIAFQAALADLAESTGRGFVREERWQNGEVRIKLEATAEHQDLMELASGNAELEASLINEFMPEGQLWWMPVFERNAPAHEWRGVSALRTNLKDWEELVSDLTPFLD